MGAPTKCTEELIEEVSNLLQMGNYVQTACAVVGISERTFYNWRNWAEEELERREAGEKPDPSKDIFISFLQAVTRASAKAEAAAVVAIRRGFTDGDWRAAVEFLERRHPGRWGRRRHVHHTGQIEHGSVLAKRLENEDASAEDLTEAYVLEVTTGDG